jgi:AcrR family transcriptional regulator
MGHKASSLDKKRIVAAFRQAGILDAARHAFAAHGFEKASVEEIARRAGVAKGTVYLYYPSKLAVYRAALRDGLAALLEELRRNVGRAQGVRDKLGAFLRTKAEFLEGHREFFGVYDAGLAHPGLPLHLQKDFQAYHQEQLALLQSALQSPGRGPRIGELESRLVAEAVSDLSGGVVRRRLLGLSRAETQRQVDAVLELVWKGLAP